jgi:hypothetical protein
MAPWSIPNTTVLLTGSTTSPAMTLVMRLGRISRVSLLEKQNEDGHLHIAGGAAQDGDELRGLDDKHARSLPSNHTKDLHSDADARNKRLADEGSPGPEFLRCPAGDEEVHYAYTIDGSSVDAKITSRDGTDFIPQIVVVMPRTLIIVAVPAVISSRPQCFP